MDKGRLRIRDYMLLVIGGIIILGTLGDLFGIKLNFSYKNPFEEKSSYTGTEKQPDANGVNESRKPKKREVNIDKRVREIEEKNRREQQKHHSIQKPLRKLDILEAIYNHEYQFGTKPVYFTPKFGNNLTGDMGITGTSPHFDAIYYIRKEENAIRILSGKSMYFGKDEYGEWDLSKRTYQDQDINGILYLNPDSTISGTLSGTGKFAGEIKFDLVR